MRIGTPHLCCHYFRAHLLVTIVLGLVAGCDDPGTIPSRNPQLRLPTQKKGFIAFVGAAKRDPLWPILRQGAEQYRKGFETLPVRYFLPQGNSPRHQVELLEKLDDPEMAGLCIHITDPEATRPSLEQLQTRGIQIVSMITPAPTDIGVGHVGIDDHAIGEMLAEAAAQALDQTGSIMLIHAGTDDRHYASRLAGFRQSIRRYADIEIFAAHDGKQNPLETRQIMRSKSERFPRLSAWVTLDDWPLRQLSPNERPVPRGMRLITFGGMPDCWPLIRDGICPAIVAANYNDIGTKAAEFCDAAIREPPRFPQIHNAPLRIVTRANLDQYIRDWGYWSTGQFADDPLMVETPQ